jgi:hypothetical protein
VAVMATLIQPHHAGKVSKEIHWQVVLFICFVIHTEFDSMGVAAMSKNNLLLDSGWINFPTLVLCSLAKSISLSSRMPLKYTVFLRCELCCQ